MLFPRSLLACFLALACTAPPALALGAGQAFGTGTAFGDERTVAMRLSAEGVVTAVDARARLMSVEGPRGTVTFRLDPRVRNAAALHAGERVRVDYVAAFLLTPRRDDDDVDEASLVRADVHPVSLASRYARPVTFTADVVALDKENLTVRLRGPAGDVAEYRVQDRSALAGMRVGEQVVVAMNQAVAVGVTPVRR